MTNLLDAFDLTTFEQTPANSPMDGTTGRFTGRLASSAVGAAPVVARARANGKFFRVGDERFLVKGVTYGTFAPGAEGEQFPSLNRVAEDFALMTAFGINTVRMYTVPSRAMLDEAARHGLRVMIGVPWTEHVAFLDDPRLASAIRRDITATVRTLADHPAVLLFALGNEIPASVVRWHGHRRVERFIRALYEDAKAAAPECTFTYVNFPPTEFLELPFLDVCAFNVYLHDQDNLRKYIRRLQHIAGNKPLLLAEAGADSMRHGEEQQAALTAMQLRTSYAEGACGAIAFAWTDEWWRGGFPVDDWAFGLVDAARRPKPAAYRVAEVFRDAPFSADEQRTWPKVSVVICAYNAAATLEDCLSSLERLTYPDFEVIVVNDGSTDRTGDIARRHPSMRLIEVRNGGLSTARNIGLAHARGRIVAYTDADVRVEPDWLTYLVQPFLTSDVVACGGPNVAPADDPWLSRAVALSPGGPTHVMFDDWIAEHVPGCNLAIDREALLAINGFNPIYLRAGDDVDVCWRLQARGGEIGFSPAALVWHHHRASIKAFWRQQVGYGEGEAWLIPHHPDKFVAGRAVWRGRIYSALPFIRFLSGTRIDAGVWGTAAFPSVYHPAVHPLALLPHSAPWMIACAALILIGGAIGSLTGVWPMAALFGGAGGLGLIVSFAKCVRCALATEARALPPVPGLPPHVSRAIVRSVIAFLHVLQPLAREVGWFRGRFGAGEELSASGDQPPAAAACVPHLHEVVHAVKTAAGRAPDARFWGESWTTSEALLTRLVKRLRDLRMTRHIDVDNGWQLTRDVSVPVGSWAWLDLRALVEDHGSSKRLLRLSQRLRLTPGGLSLSTVGLASAPLAFVLGHPVDVNAFLALWAAVVATAASVALWQLTRVVAAVGRACVLAAADVDMAPIGSQESKTPSLGFVTSSYEEYDVAP